MVRIRLRRVGAKGQPSYRIVAADKESPRDGRYLEILGHYNPRTEPATVEVDEDRVFHWISNGAQPSESVAQIFRTLGLTERLEARKKGGDVQVVEEVEAVEAVVEEVETEVEAVEAVVEEVETEAEEPEVEEEE